MLVKKPEKPSVTEDLVVTRFYIENTEIKLSKMLMVEGERFELS